MTRGVVADDITGANDIGIMFAKSGYVAHVYAHDSVDPGAIDPEQRPDIIILDTNSRLDDSNTAYQKVFAATRTLQQAGVTQFFNKTCSVFRGNIGAEFDAMLDALEQDFAIVVLGFPKNGRVTRDGVHYVHGKRLEESEFRHDPAHPMTQSNLVEILQAQTQRRVALIDYRTVAGGPQALRECIEQMRPEYQYVILDVLDQQALATIAHAVHDYPVLCGSSALAEELPAVWGSGRSDQCEVRLPAFDQRGVLCAAGSLMPQTAAQIRYMEAQGAAVFALDTVALFDSHQRLKQMERLPEELAHRLMAGENVVVHSSGSADMIAETRAAGVKQGLSSTAAARHVSEAIAGIVSATVAKSGVRRIVVAGGETSAAVCRKLGVSGMRVWREIQPGLPSCVSLTDPPLLLVLKSGSFGSPSFIAEAIAHLKAQ